MPARLARAASFILFGWFVFVMGAVAFAKVKGRDAVPQDPDADEVDLVATFGPLDFASTAKAFRGGSVTTWFGGGTLDLRGATLDPGGATLRASALFGGGSLIVPEDWNVETRLIGLGGAGDGRGGDKRDGDGPTLRLEGIAVFGGWGISSQPPTEEYVPA
jgi:hypothetical protein